LRHPVNGQVDLRTDIQIENPAVSYEQNYV